MPLPYKALFLDLSGVLYEGSRVINGAADFVARARHRGLTLRFVTNTASKSSQTILENIQFMGIAVKKGELFTAPLAARAYIQKQQWRPLCLIHKAIQQDFADLDQRNPNCVLLGDARDDLNYQNLNNAFRLCQRGAPLIGIGKNKYFKDDDGMKLDAGPFIHALEWAADTRAIIMGKPSRGFFAQVVASTPFAPAECMMVGDDVIGDVEGAATAGLQACLVRTGKYRPADEEKLPAAAVVIDSVGELF